jgi:hypothetical protein
MLLDRNPTSDNPVGTWKNSAEKQRGKTASGKRREGRKKADLIKRAQHAVKTLQKLAKRRRELGKQLTALWTKGLDSLRNR